MIKIVFTAALSGLLLLPRFSATAQTNEISFSAGGGLSGLSYTIKNGSSTLKPGFQAGVGVTHFLNSRWGIATGLELGYYRTRATLAPNTVFSAYEIDSEGNAFEYRVKTKGYEEKQKLYALQVPLMLQFQPLSKSRTQLYALGGVKFALPVSSSYQTKADEINATGYYPDVNAEITDLPAHGFGTQTNWTNKGDYDFKLSYALAAETGARFRLSSGNYLYAGLFIDYGLNNIKKQEGDQTLLTYNPTAVNQSQANGVFSLANTTGAVRLLTYGIKLRIAFAAGTTKKAVTAPPVATETPVQPAIPVKAEEEPKTGTVAEPPVKEESVSPEPPVQPTLTETELAILKAPLPFNRVGDTALSEAAKAQADQVAELLLQHPGMELQIQGHTCNIGSEAVNRQVGMARAKAAAAYLQGKGIAAARMHLVSKGAEEPLVPNTSEANRKQNRRIVFKVSDQ
jgi:OmpA-OmpF porin, OOP family